MRTIDDYFEMVPKEEFVTMVQLLGDILGVPNKNIHYQEQEISKACLEQGYQTKSEDEIMIYCLGEANVPKKVHDCALRVLERAINGDIKIVDKNLRSGKVENKDAPKSYDIHENYSVGQIMMVEDFEAKVVAKLPKDKIRVKFKDKRTKVLLENVQEYKPQSSYKKDQRINTEFGIGTVTEIMPHDRINVRYENKTNMIYRVNVADEDKLYSRDESPYLQAHRVDL